MLSKTLSQTNKHCAKSRGCIWIDNITKKCSFSYEIFQLSAFTALLAFFVVEFKCREMDVY